MSDDEDWEEKKRAIEKEVRAGRSFSMADAIGREGGGFFRGASPVPGLDRATALLCQFIVENVDDPSGALRIVLERRVRTNEPLVGDHFDDPFVALEIIVERMLNNSARYYELVREVDAEWGRLMLERPHFQQPGQKADPEDEYTHTSVRVALESLLAKVRTHA